MKDAFFTIDDPIDAQLTTIFDELEDVTWRLFALHNEFDGKPEYAAFRSVLSEAFQQAQQLQHDVNRAAEKAGL